MKRFCLILFGLFWAVQSIWAYDYAGTQTKANKRCAHYLWFPLKHYQKPCCTFTGYKFDSGNWHGGNDYAVAAGTPVYAAANGIVVKAIDGMSGTTNSPNYGNEVELQHSNGLRTIYGHLKCNSIRVKTGQIVKTGQMVGLSGNTGWSSTPHLHFEVRIDSNPWSMGTPIDPYPKLWTSNPPTPAIDRAVSQAAKRALQEAAQALRQIQDEMLFGLQGAVVNPFSSEAKVVACNIPNGAKEVDCILNVRFKFSRPVQLDDIISSFETDPFIGMVTPLDALSINYIQNDRRKVEVAGMVLFRPHTKYTIGLNKKHHDRDNPIAPWEISFTTGDLPNP